MASTGDRGAENGGGGSPEWYACYTRARHEKRVDARLGERGFETFLPLIPRVRQWHDRETVVEWPLFASYVFVRCDVRSMADVLRTPGVATVVKFNGRPVPVPEEDIANVRRFVGALREQEDVDWEPEPLVEEGERVRLTSGPFEGVRGVVLERRGRQRALIQIGVEAIGQGVKLEVDARSLEKLEAEEAEETTGR